ncbi:MAG: hypothetical protein IKH59_01750 [Bacteroidaceae bacterium]|nr:hypothetical protein [Bacteroidaceae bacterium]
MKGGAIPVHFDSPRNFSLGFRFLIAEGRLRCEVSNAQWEFKGFPREFEVDFFRVAPSFILNLIILSKNALRCIQGNREVSLTVPLGGERHLGFHIIRELGTEGKEMTFVKFVFLDAKGKEVWGPDKTVPSECLPAFIDDLKYIEEVTELMRARKGGAV